MLVVAANPHDPVAVDRHDDAARGRADPAVGQLVARHGPTLRVHVRHDLGMTALFDDVDVERLRRRRTVKWTLYGPDVLAAWVAEMDFDVAPVVRAAVLDAVDREDFGYVEADLSALTDGVRGVPRGQYGWVVPPARIFPVADVLGGISTALDVFVAPGRGVVVPTPAYPPFFEVVELTGRPVVAAPMIRDGDRDTLDLDVIDAALAAGARAVLLCSPHNPTGPGLHDDGARGAGRRSSIGTARG